MSMKIKLKYRWTSRISRYIVDYQFSEMATMDKNKLTEKSQLITRIYACIPYSTQISSLDIESEYDAIRFVWRGARFRVSLSGMVEEILDNLLSSSDAAILMEQLIKQSQR